MIHAAAVLALYAATVTTPAAAPSVPVGPWTDPVAALPPRRRRPRPQVVYLKRRPKQ